MQRSRDNLFAILVTDDNNPRISRHIHYSVEFIINLFLKLWLKPNFNLARENYINEYAQHAFDLYDKRVSLDRLRLEARDVFPSKKTFTKTFTSFFGKHVHKFVKIMRSKIAKHPWREWAVDGNEKMVKLLKLFDSSAKYTVEASLNFAVAGGCGLIGNSKLYAKHKESNENIANLVLEPVMTSIEVCETYEDVTYAVGIDHPHRNYGAPEILIQKIVSELLEMMDDENDDVYISPTGIKYALSDFKGIVKFCYVTDA